MHASMLSLAQSHVSAVVRGKSFERFALQPCFWTPPTATALGHPQSRPRLQQLQIKAEALASSEKPLRAADTVEAERDSISKRDNSVESRETSSNDLVSESLGSSNASSLEEQIIEEKGTSQKELDKEEADIDDGPLTEDEIRTQEYLDLLGGHGWDEDPPGHRSGYIAILGRPNAGKSTLMNALLGQKLSIVTAKAQTTRHKILSLINESEYQMVLLDTPGIMTKERNKLDTKMMKAVWQSARSADALIGIIDLSANPQEAVDTIEQILRFEDAKKLPFALVLNKVDLVSKTDVETAVSWFQTTEGLSKIIPISAKHGQGIEDVKDWAINQLPQGPSLYPKDAISEEPERFFIAEIVREKIFLQFREEIPYSSTAEVTEYVTRPGAKDLVRVHVYVESDSQKGILLGKQGSALKKLSTSSRLAIEEFLDKDIYLDLTIKVQKEWRSDEKAVTGFGY